uniref:NADH dehydrogenase subunit 4L n=1 Tax=Eledone cirrhosa TaxID=102876 RepID=UPI0022FD636D|nr:NADH dehydrogenase subunit 4L [Eledone cirrhosa]WAP91612.1 NADH dehydrogenase subunit 4L [Eledone cirrhosa]
MIMNNGLLLGGYMYMCGLIILMFQWKHVLNMLLGFEVLTLSVVFMLMFSWGYISLSMYMVILLIVFGVCEASLGLSLLVSFIRLHGNDYVGNMSVMKL